MEQYELWCGNTLVGIVSGVFFSDNTYYGFLEIGMKRPEREIEQRILDLIALSESWNRRYESDPVNPPLRSEFDLFEDMIEGNLWRVKSLSTDRIQPIAHAPVFLDGGEISWTIAVDNSAPSAKQ